MDQEYKKNLVLLQINLVDAFIPSVEWLLRRALRKYCKIEAVEMVTLVLCMKQCTHNNR